MGEFASRIVLRTLAWAVAVIIVALNIKLLYDAVFG